MIESFSNRIVRRLILIVGLNVVRTTFSSFGTMNPNEDITAYVYRYIYVIIIIL